VSEKTNRRSGLFFFTETKKRSNIGLFRYDRQSIHCFLPRKDDEFSREYKIWCVDGKITERTAGEMELKGEVFLDDGQSLKQASEDFTNNENAFAKQDGNRSCKSFTLPGVPIKTEPGTASSSGVT
jgi:hypothetical protein